MSIDLYQQCPCHEGTKIKFCCGKEVVDGLNLALAKHGSGQTKAALEQLDRSIASVGENDCLLALKTFLLISVDDIDAAEVTNEKFLTNLPDHSTGLQHRAQIELSRGEISQAALTLQDAMDAIDGSELPVMLARPFESLGMSFVGERNILAARAHLSFAKFLEEDSDSRLTYALRELYNPSGASYFLKANHQLAPPEEGAEWEKQFTNVHRAVGRGQFRRALGMLLQLSEKFPDTPAIAQGIAIVTSMFAPLEAQIATWRNVAAMSSTEPKDAIEFYGLADALAQIAGEGLIPVNRCTWEIDEFEPISEACISNDQLAPMEQQMQQDPFGEGPAPRAGYFLLDKQELRSAEQLSFDTVPFTLAEVLLYGKQTDRPARVELVCVQGDRYDEALKLLSSTISISGEPMVAAFDNADAEREALTWNWRLPEDTSPEQHKELVDQMKQAALMRWLDVKPDFIDGKTIREAASDESLKNWVQSKICNLELMSHGQAFDADSIDGLRKELGLSGLEKLAPATDETLTPTQMCRIDAGKISDEQLMGYFEIATLMQNFPALRLLTPELLKRDHIEGARRDICHVTMARMVETHDEALEHFAQSRAEAAKLGMPLGVLLVAEFEYRLRNGLEDKLDSLLQTIEARHMEEPGVANELGRLFQALGLQPGAMPSDGEQAIPQPAASETAQSGGDDSGSGLWIPD